MRTQTRTRALILAVLLMLVLAACKPATGEPYGTGTAAPVAEPATRQPITAATVTQPATQVSAAVQSAPEGCTVISPQPTPGPTEQSIFPPVDESDWTKGLDSAYVTIIEYSDYQ